MAQRSKSNKKPLKDLGKKNEDAIFEFQKDDSWLQSAGTALRYLLQYEIAQGCLIEFLQFEMGYHGHIEFILGVDQMEYMEANDQETTAYQYYEMLMAGIGAGISQFEQIPSAQSLVDYAIQNGMQNIDAKIALRVVRQQAELIVKLLALNVFPKFMRTPQFQQLMQSISEYGDMSQLTDILSQVDEGSPKNVDEWLNMFVNLAEVLPASIIISDMTIASAPMVFVSQEFIRCTGYSKDEALGRNCRILQSKGTERDVVSFMRSSISRGQGCIVSITNFKRNGDPFNNLLAFKPFYDCEGIYRYMIAFSLEFKDDPSFKNRLVALDKMLELIPMQSYLPSSATSRYYGSLAVRLTGDANEMVGEKYKLLQQAKLAVQAEEKQYISQNKPRPPGQLLLTTLFAGLDYTNTIFAFTKIMWLNKPVESMQAIISDPIGREMFSMFTGITATVFRVNFEFCCSYDDINKLQGAEQQKLIRNLHRKKYKNSMFYCTTTEINYGSLDHTNWGAVAQSIGPMHQMSLSILAAEALPKFMNSRLSHALIARLRDRELKNDQKPLRTAAFGVDMKSESCWLDMFRAMAETMSIGMVVTDVTIPGAPLAYVNDGFRAVTGYGKEKIGTNCRFLQGPETQDYLVREMSKALRESSPLLVKLHNYKSNGQLFQCLLALHPVMGPDDQYLFQIGMLLDFGMHGEITKQLLELERTLRFLPSTITGNSDASESKRILPQEMMGDSTLFPIIKIDPSVVAGPQARSEVAQVMDAGKEVVTKKGKGKDQYGRDFGKKQKNAMLKFTKALWMQDATTSLRNILSIPLSREVFCSFLTDRTEIGLLEFSLEVMDLATLPAQQKTQQIMQVYQSTFMAVGSKGIGEQERTSSTQEVWDKLNRSSSSLKIPDLNTCQKQLQEELENSLKLLAMDAFPRFVKSSECKALMEQMTQVGGSGAQQVQGLLEQAGISEPVDADDWLNIFITSAELFPASIVISDMTIPGAPMVFVNQEFCRTTGYSKEEATGRNCRFLQGPDTEPEAIAVIRNTLCKGQDCHVKLTNYRRSGEKFQNLLSMRPVFDADDIYRFVIGVQFDLKDDDNLKKRLIQLDKLLQLLPTKLNVKSKAKARAKGMLAVKTTGEANENLSNKERLLKQAKSEEMQEKQLGGARPQEIVTTSTNYDPRHLNYSNTIAAFTKIMWLQDPLTACRGILVDQMCRSYFSNFAEAHCGITTKTHILFFDWAMQIHNASGPDQAMVMRGFHMEYQQNPLFYCTTNEIPVGQLDNTDWGAIYENMCVWQEQTIVMLATDAFQRFLEDPSSTDMIVKLQQREAAGEELPLQTAAVGVDPFSDRFWCDIFANMSETLSIGMVVSDMTVPGIPIIYINEGFRSVTGHGKEKIGTNCRFLQGPETELYLNDEIMGALQQSEPLLVKLHNYKADGQKFQCLLALHPVFGPAPEHEYKYVIGMQLDFNDQDPDLQFRVAEMARVVRNLPQTVGGEKPTGVDAKVKELEAIVEACRNGKYQSPVVSAPKPMGAMGGSGGAPRGMGAPMGGGGAPRGPPGAMNGGMGMGVGGPRPPGGMNGASNGNTPRPTVGMNGSNGMAGGAPRPPAAMNGGMSNGGGMNGGGMGNGGNMNGGGMTSGMSATMGSAPRPTMGGMNGGGINTSMSMSATMGATPRPMGMNGNSMGAGAGMGAPRMNGVMNSVSFDGPRPPSNSPRSVMSPRQNNVNEQGQGQMQGNGVGGFSGGGGVGFGGNQQQQGNMGPGAGAGGMGFGSPAAKRW